MRSIEFHKFTSKDFEAYYRLVSDERVMAQITERAIPKSEAEENYQKLLLRNQETRFGSFKVLVSQTDTFIGYAHLTPKEDEAEIGYMFLPEYWNQGYGKATMQKLLELGDSSEFSLLTAIIDPENVASRRLLTSNGFETDFLGLMDGLQTEILKKRIK